MWFDRIFFFAAAIALSAVSVDASTMSGAPPIVNLDRAHGTYGWMNE